MGSVGDSYDNAPMENFWSTLKIELVCLTSWRTRDETGNAIFSCVDSWCGIRRIQKLGYLSPDEYETASHAQAQPDNLTPAPQPEAGNHPSKRGCPYEFVKQRG
jgi:transposase InsO family protein